MKRLNVATSAGEDDIVYLMIQCLDPIHNDLRVVDVFGDEARSVAYGQHGILQQRVILDKLKGLIRQVERAADILLSHQVVNTLVKETELNKDKEGSMVISTSIRVFSGPQHKVWMLLTAPGRGEGVTPLCRIHLVWDCSTVAFCMYLPLEKTSSTAVML